MHPFDLEHLRLCEWELLVKAAVAAGEDDGRKSKKKKKKSKKASQSSAKTIVSGEANTALKRMGSIGGWR